MISGGPRTGEPCAAWRRKDGATVLPPLPPPGCAALAGRALSIFRLDQWIIEGFTNVLRTERAGSQSSVGSLRA
jgi:hypothetical protein